MNKYKIIDKKNTYIPNLNNITESALRQFVEGNFFLEMANNTIDKYYNITNADLIYDLSNSLASTLAFACESFLKALYIFENKTEENNINLLWENLKKPEKIDANRDKKKVKGHDLDILIDNLSLDSKTLIETRLLTINSEKTEKYEEVTIYDILQKNNKVKRLNLLEENKYHSWVEHHKRTFEKARYGGQIYHKVNLEFLFHLATQICAVAQYKICPTEEQKKFNNFENIEELPTQVIKLFHLDSSLVDEKLINLISKNKDKREVFIKIMKNETIINTVIKKTIIEFYKLIKYFNYDEIVLIVNYINEYNREYIKKKQLIDKATKERGFICLEDDKELDKINYLIPNLFGAYCLIAKTEYRIDINESSIRELTNIYLKKEIHTENKNIIKLAKKFNR